MQFLRHFPRFVISEQADHSFIWIQNRTVLVIIHSIMLLYLTMMEDCVGSMPIPVIKVD